MSKHSEEKQRCGWCLGSPLEMAYHDTEWGTPLHDDQKLFEFLILEGAQAGLSWVTILKKRDNYRAAMDNFDAEKIARYDENKYNELMGNAGIVRNRLKISSTISNAQLFLDVQSEYGSFDKWIWQFVGGEPKVNNWQTMSDVPSNTAASDAMCKALKKKGFRFVGTTICYAFMQATGMVNDHSVDCFRHAQLKYQQASE
ncbi:MAG: DNA-3-methyladenine glycosylase I [Xanthomonadales bacterium]|nr:DNA-3-methyladenine glycosylase I [Xanthomonadales bacterium]